MIRLTRSAIFLGASILQCLAPPNPLRAAPADPATQPATAQVPVKEVVLFSSGVGYFEHYGTIHGDAATELRFKREQINDILKSLLLEDMDGGKVSTVTYGSQGPLSHTLHSFQVDISTNPPLAELLNQLRGAKVTTGLKEGPLTGTILGAEKKRRNIGEKDHPQVMQSWWLNLWSEGSIRPVDLDTITSLKLDDPQLQDELNKALAALAQARDQDKKPVVIHFGGQGDRRVRIGYVVEAPVWKTSYRLVMPADGAGAGGGGEAKGPGDATTQPARPPRSLLRVGQAGWGMGGFRAGRSWRTRPTVTGMTCSCRW